MFSFRYTTLVIGAQVLLFIAVILVGSVWPADALFMGLFFLYYPFIALAVLLGIKGMIGPFVAAVIIGIPVYGLIIGSILKRLRSGKGSA